MIKKVKFCACGCDKEIVFKPYHKYVGTPKYLTGHHKRDKEIKPHSEEHNLTELFAIFNIEFDSSIQFEKSIERVLDKSLRTLIAERINLSAGVNEAIAKLVEIIGVSLISSTVRKGGLWDSILEAMDE